MSYGANKRYGPKPHNYTMLQAFEWYVPGGGKHWKTLQDEIPKLADIGITALWLPPPTKAAGENSVGYDIYDGEFKQKAGVATKYGTKDDLLAAMKVASSHGVVCYLDAVLNHKFGADKIETFRATMVDKEDRTKDAMEPYDIEGWTSFTFPGRNLKDESTGVTPGDSGVLKYSNFKWDFNHFTGVDWDAKGETSAIFRIDGKNKGWALAVDHEDGNYDYLMGADIDHAHPDARADLLNWGQWIVENTDHVGFRFDAIKHIDENFMKDFVARVRKSKEGVFAVGEFWKDSVEDIVGYLDRFGEQFSIFDTPLHYNFKQASDQGSGFDLRKIWDGTLVQARPIDAVTVVDNHDTASQQIGQALASWISPWFKPLAYAMILLRVDGYPCVFWGDLYGCGSGNPDPPAQQPVGQLVDIIKARKHFAYGDTRDYWDYPTCVGWVRTGDKTHDGCAVVLCNGDANGTKWMEVGKEHAGEKWIDLLGWTPGELTINQDGWAEFKSPARSIGIWINEKARGCGAFKKHH